MGRPPNPNGRRSAELGKKYFTVPIPPVDPRVHAAVESRIASRHPWLVQRAQLDKAESQLLENRARQEASLQKVQQLSTTRSLALNEISTLRNTQLQQSLVELDTNLRNEFTQAQQQQQVQLEKECEALLQSLPPDEEEEEEPPTKRLKVDNEDLNEEESKEEGQVESEKETTDMDTTTSNVASTTSDAAAATTEEEPKPSVLKKKQLEEAESELEGLTETKHQMIWLLKQVIKAEAKQKMQPKLAEAKAT